MRLGVLASLSLSLFAFTACGKGGDDAAPQPDAGSDTPDPGTFSVPPSSCGYICPQDGTCDEQKPGGGYQCPSLGDWAQIPHDTTCAWDGTPPAPIKGTCTSSAPTGEAAKYTGVQTDGSKILPDGRRVRPAGAEFEFAEPDLSGGLPSAILSIPGKPWVVTLDNGYGPHVVRAIDVTKIGSGDPVLGRVKFDAPKTLGNNATFVAPDRLYLPTTDGVMQAIKLDATSGALSLDDAHTIKLPESSANRDGSKNWKLSAVAASPDGKRLIAGAVMEKSLLVYDVDAASPTVGTKIGEVSLGANEVFSAAFDPHDATSRHAYVTLWASRQVAEIDVGADGGPKVLRTFGTDKDPQGLTFLDARWMVVATSMGDVVDLIDRVAGTVTPVAVDADAKQHGFDPSNVAYDEAHHRLYATLAGTNAVAAWDVDLTAMPAKITPAGRLPTGWWPGAVTTLDDGTVAIANMRANFLANDPKKWLINDGDVMGKTWGSIQKVPFPTSADLAAGEAAVKANNDVGALAGAPAVTCPGANYDFPIPKTNTEGPSKLIKHVIFVVRENKTFDGIFGDLPGVNGDPSMVLGKDAAQQNAVFANVRALAKDFTVSDNYYTDAELSQQGHFWTVYGRSSDYNERTWAVDGYTRDIRHTPYPSGGVVDMGQTTEGSSFDWLATHEVGYEILGEALGLPHVKLASGPNPIDSNYPGGFIQSISWPDVEKACYVVGRARVRCDLRSFVYMTLPNDHTAGLSPKTPTPDSMVAGNDEATGILIDGISKSPLWESTLIIITEDDPAVGGEHVDIHRTPLVMISPWVKRGYVSKTHIDVASLHKIFAHVFGLPYPNVQVANASIPFDAFTSTPDFGTWNRKPRTWPLTCGGMASAAEQLLTQSFDLEHIDESPGLSRQVERWMKGRPKQSLTPAEEAEARARIARKAERAAAVEPALASPLVVHEDEDDDD